ncbi:MAG: P2 family phage major capsid protein [Aeromonas sp.]
MENFTRDQFDGYLAQQAKLNGVTVAAVSKQFAVEPAVQQRLENVKQESSDFLKAINSFGVTEQEGQKVGISVSGPIASRNAGHTDPRMPNAVHSLTATTYRLEQTNFDTYLGYAQLDAWAMHKDFQARISRAIAEREALDRLMIGFNGVSVAVKSDPAANPLLQDVNVGWLQKMRLNAPERVMSDE